MTNKNLNKKIRKIIEHDAHGTAYFKEANILHGYPMTQSGGFDEKTPFMIEESPKSYRKAHQKIAKKLGIKKLVGRYY